MNDEAILVLEDGTVFHGQSIGISGSAVGEVVFNTSMTGYQEILTDPSYAYQMITLTYPHIGNVGTNVDDEESSQVYAQGLIVRDVSLLASNYRNQETLGSYLKRHRIVAIAHVDTRKLTRVLCQQGAQKGCIIAGETPDVDRALQQARAFPGLNGMDLAKVVTTRECYEWTQGSWFAAQMRQEAARERALPHHVVVYDFGVKRTILRLLVDRGCHLTVVPAETSADAVIALDPDGILLSNGPGDPAACHYAIHAIQRLLQSNIPIFGICLGHQLLALACGAKTVKMKFGHHGANHPVKDQLHDRVMITAQNHSFAVDQATLPVYLKATHWSLFDESLQGIHHLEKPAFSFQGHPEASPGPQDAAALFDHFVDLIIHYRQAAPTACPNSQCANGVK